LDRLVIRHSHKREATVSRLQFNRTFRFILVLLTVTPTATFAQSSLSQKGQNPAAPNFQPISPMNAGNSGASSHGICPLLEKIGPFLTSDDAELAAQSARYQLLPASSIYSQGWPDSYFDPLRYYFNVTILTPCN
jgi:hypothetical protein